MILVRWLVSSLHPSLGPRQPNPVPLPLVPLMADEICKPRTVMTSKIRKVAPILLLLLSSPVSPKIRLFWFSFPSPSPEDVGGRILAWPPYPVPAKFQRTFPLFTIKIRVFSGPNKGCDAKKNPVHDSRRKKFTIRAVIEMMFFYDRRLVAKQNDISRKTWSTTHRYSKSRSDQIMLVKGEDRH